MTQLNEIQLNNSSWFKHWFDSSFYHVLYANRSEQEATDFVDELIAELRPNENASMLDLGCGNGRHSKRLAAEGFKVTGLDLAASSIRSAKRFESDSLRFYRHDMRVPFGVNCFNYVFNFFTSFGYFENDDDHQRVVANISASLTHKGVLVMDYLNVRFAEKNLVRFETKETDGVFYKIERWTDSKFLFKKIVVENFQGEKPLEFVEQVAKFSIADFDLMFKRSGLQIEKVFGDYRLNNFDCETSPRLILLATKK